MSNNWLIKQADHHQPSNQLWWFGYANMADGDLVIPGEKLDQILFDMLKGKAKFLTMHVIITPWQITHPVRTKPASISWHYFFPSNPEDTIGCRIVFCGWKAKVSTRVQISKFDKTHYQVLCGIPPAEKHKGTHLFLTVETIMTGNLFQTLLDNLNIIMLQGYWLHLTRFCQAHFIDPTCVSVTHLRLPDHAHFVPASLCFFLIVPILWCFWTKQQAHSAFKPNSLSKNQPITVLIIGQWVHTQISGLDIFRVKCCCDSKEDI